MKLLVPVLAALASTLSPAQQWTDAGARAVAASYAHEATGAYDSAITSLTAARLPASDYFFNLRLAWLWYLNKEYAAAATGYRAASTARPQSIEARIGLLNCLFESHQTPVLQDEALALLSLDPANYSAHRYLLLATIARKEYAKAELRAREALAYYPIDLALNISLAQVLLAQSRPDDAREIAVMLSGIYGKTNADVVTLLKTLP